MITNLLLYATLSQNLNKPNPAESHDVVLILAKSEDEINLQDITVENASQAELEKRGIQCHEFKIDNQIIFISERVAPINALESASKLMADLHRNNTSTFAYGSEIGKQFKQVFESVSPRLKSDAKPEDNCYGIALQMSFKSPTDPLKNPITTPIGLKLRDVAHPLIKQATPDEQKSMPAPPRNSFFIAFSEFAKLDYVIKPLITRRRQQYEAVDSLIAVSNALKQASEKVATLHNEYAQYHARLVDRLMSEYANELSEIPKEGAKFDKLPKFAQDLIENQIRNFPESMGLKSPAEADEYLKSNPVFKVDFTLSIYEGTSQINPSTGKPSRSGTFINLGNPAK
ncbi:MAG: hypothetical protein ACKVQS_13695 [Fimbriimonadaceae bacterium]